MSLNVSFVAAHETLWSGEASIVLARTLEGELAIMSGHTPLLGILSPGEVRVTPTEGQQFSADVEGGFLSVEGDRVLLVVDAADVENVKR